MEGILAAVKRIVDVYDNPEDETRYFRVAWKDTWEPELNLVSCTDALSEFWKHKSKLLNTSDVPQKVASVACQTDFVINSDNSGDLLLQQSESHADEKKQNSEEGSLHKKRCQDIALQCELLQSASPPSPVMDKQMQCDLNVNIKTPARIEISGHAYLRTDVDTCDTDCQHDCETLERGVQHEVEFRECGQQVQVEVMDFGMHTKPQVRSRGVQIRSFGCLDELLYCPKCSSQNMKLRNSKASVLNDRVHCIDSDVNHDKEVEAFYSKGTLVDQSHSQTTPYFASQKQNINVSDLVSDLPSGIEEVNHMETNDDTNISAIHADNTPYSFNVCDGKHQTTSTAVAIDTMQRTNVQNFSATTGFVSASNIPNNVLQNMRIIPVSSHPTNPVVLNNIQSNTARLDLQEADTNANCSTSMHYGNYKEMLFVTDTLPTYTISSESDTIRKSVLKRKKTADETAAKPRKSIKFQDTNETSKHLASTNPNSIASLPNIPGNNGAKTSFQSVSALNTVGEPVTTATLNSALLSKSAGLGIMQPLQIGAKFTTSFCPTPPKEVQSPTQFAVPALPSQPRPTGLLPPSNGVSGSGTITIGGGAGCLSLNNGFILKNLPCSSPLVLQNVSPHVGTNKILASPLVFQNVHQPMGNSKVLASPLVFQTIKPAVVLPKVKSPPLILPKKATTAVEVDLKCADECSEDIYSPLDGSYASTVYDPKSPSSIRASPTVETKPTFDTVPTDVEPTDVPNDEFINNLFISKYWKEEAVR